MPSIDRLPTHARRAALPTAAGTLLAVLLLAAPGVAAAAPCDAPLSNLQRRIVAEASQGDAALVRFVHRTKPVYQLDVASTAQWLDAESRRRTRCMAAVGAGRDGSLPAGSMPGAPSRP